MAVIDEAYEFEAPRFFDFIDGESEADACEAEFWFDTALSYAPSPFMPRIKTCRSVTVGTLCDFSEADQMQASESSSTTCQVETKHQSDSDIISSKIGVKEVPFGAREDDTEVVNTVQVGNETSTPKAQTTSRKLDQGRITDSKKHQTAEINVGLTVRVGNETCTPKVQVSRGKVDGRITDSKKHQAAERIASLVRNPSALKPKKQLHSSQAKSIKASSTNRDKNVKSTAAGTPNFAQENQAIKRQKLEGGGSRQILSIKPQNLLHKSKLGLPTGNSNLCSSTANKTRKEDRKVYVREPAAPFVSMAEMMKRFQSSTRDLSLPLTQLKPKLTLTRPKEPELETAQRVRSVRIKSTAELEEEMMAKIPKFKARPLNKKILDGPSLPALARSTPQKPEFQEFRLETMVRAYQNAAESTAPVASAECSHQHDDQWKPHLTEPKPPVLHTSLRARPPRAKSFFELEQEELEKIPKFKARPLNKKIFESKGDLGLFCNAKKQITIPQEFHFATNERIPPPAIVADLFDKISLNSEPRHENQIPKITVPNPFNLQTEERGAEKEKKFVMEVINMQLEEERARIPKANPYPYTTDYPVIPPKPEPKHSTKPEPFQLESLMRHEEEMQREMEERVKKEKEEAQMRVFKAQPILKEDPIPVPEKVRKPLTQVQEFILHADHRAVDRAEFDQKIKEKEMMYKRYRDESEAAQMMEEEKALKQLRRTMVPHAKPVPNFDHPFCPQKSFKETTKAKSPKLRVLQRLEKRRMVNARTSSAATHMR